MSKNHFPLSSSLTLVFCLFFLIENFGQTDISINQQSTTKKDRKKEIRNTLKSTLEHEYDTDVIDPPEVINALFKEEGLFRNFDPADEVIELRSQNTKHFRNADGTMSAIIGAGDIHYWEDSKWKMILSHILPYKTQEFKDYDFAAIHNKHKIFFPGNPGKPIVTKIRNELYEDWGQPAMIWLDSNANILSQIQLNPFSYGIPHRDSLTYPNIFPNIDAVILNSVTSKKLSYILRDSSILTNKPDGAVYLAFRETIKTSSAWKLTGTNSNESIFASTSSGQLLQDIMFMNVSGDAVLEIKTPLYYEQRPTSLYSDTAKIDSTSHYYGSFLVRQSDSGYDSYTLVPLHWLTHPNRDFPLVIDPTTNYYPDDIYTYKPTYSYYRSGNSGSWGCLPFSAGQTYAYDITYGWRDDTWPTSNPFFDGHATFNIAALADNSCISAVTYYWYKYYSRYCATDVTLKFGRVQNNENLSNQNDCNICGSRIRNNNSYYNGTGNNGANGWKNQSGSVADLVAALPGDQITLGWAYNCEGGDCNGDCCTGWIGWPINAYMCTDDDGNYHHVYGYQHSTLKPYVQVNYDIASTPATSATASVNPICSGQSTTLTFSGGSLGSGASWNWYSSGCGSGFVGTGSSIVVSPGSTTTYWVLADAPCYTTTCVSVTVTVNSIPATPTSSNNGPLCEGATLNLSTPLVGSATYSWTGPNAFSSSLQNPTIAGVTVANAGVYSVTVTVSGCTSLAGNTTVVINATPATPTPSNNGPLCEGATLNLSTPLVGSATYSWTGPNAFTSALQNPAIAGVTLANAGVYSVTVTVSGCTSLAGNTTVVIDPVPVTPTASNNGPLCEGDTLDLSTPFVASTTYSWTGPNAFSSSLQNPTIAGVVLADTGIYSVTVTVSGCTSAAGATTVVINPIPAAPTASNNGPLCEGDTLDLTTPFVASATYSWTGPNAFSSSSQNPTIAGIALADTGIYSVTVTVSGCTSPVGNTTVVIIPVPATPTATNNGPLCEGDTLDLTTPFVAGATYSWTGPNAFSSSSQDTTIAGVVLADTGIYSVTVTVSGCTSAAGNTTVTINTPPDIDSLASTDVTVCGADDGTITITASGGTPPLQYSIDGGVTFASSGSFTGLSAGSYSVIVSDTNSCTVTDSTLTINSPGAPAAPVAGTNATYCDGDPVADLTATGTNIEWFSDTALTTLIGTGSPFAITPGVGTTTYYVTQTDSGGCQSPANYVVIIVNAIPSVPAAGTDTAYCEGDPMIDLTATAGSGGTLTWYSDAGLTVIIGTGTTHTPGTTIGATIYYVTETVSGCESPYSSVIITINSIPAAPNITGATFICQGNSTTLTASGGGPYLWSTGATDTSIIVSPLTDTTFYVTITNSCGSSVDSIVITVGSGVNAEFDADPSEGEAPLEVEFTDMSTGADSWQWDFGDGEDATKQDPTHTYENEGEFDVILIVTNSTSGCTDSASISIIVTMDEVMIVFIPEVFSPNNDGINDVLYVRGKGIEWILLRIYDRWGKLVFESVNIDDGWDGKVNGKLMNAGVFVYRLEVTFLNGDTHEEQGDITLVR